MISKTTASVSVALLVVASIAVAQNPRGTAETSIGGKKVSVEYGRPSLKGRDMLGQAPAGTIWRTGADTSTTFMTEADLNVGGKTIPAGSYSLWTKRLDDKNWALIFNKQTGQWGTSHDAGQDFAEVPLKWTQGSSSHEQFTMELTGGTLRMLWGEHVLELPLKTK